jgi:multiple sugar transport system permease protein
LTILVTSWWSFPYAMVIVTAAIQSIQGAVRGSGHRRWRLAGQARHVTFPHLIPTLGSLTLTRHHVPDAHHPAVVLEGAVGATTTLSFEAFQEPSGRQHRPTAVYSIVICC